MKNSNQTNIPSSEKNEIERESEKESNEIKENLNSPNKKKKSNLESLKNIGLNFFESIIFN
jgi:hypothetical protein